MDMTIPKLFNEKIAVKQVTEEIKGSIILPQNRVLKFEMGEVLATGDGQYRDGTKRDQGHVRDHRQLGSPGDRS